MTAPIHAPAVPVGADLNYIAKQTEVVRLAHESFSKDWSVTLNGQPLILIQGEFMSLSHRMTVLDSSKKKLYQIRRETFTMGPSVYYAELEEDGPRVWEIEFESHLLSGTESIMKFKNAANGSQMDTLSFKNNPIGSTGYVTYRGQQVAEIKKIRFQMSETYEITISQGLDMSLICAMMLCMSDKIQSSNSAAAAGAAGGAC